VRIANFILILSLAACGGTSTVEADLTTCPLLTGKFKTNATRTAMDGECPWAKLESHDSISFDSRGAIEMPVPGVATCRTVQRQCALDVTCNSDLFGGVQGVIRAAVAEDGESFTGRGVAVGDYQGCKRVDYHLEARR